MSELTSRLYTLFTESDFADPFNFKFDKPALEKSITNGSKKELEYIEVAELFNKYFEELIGHILKTLQEHNFSSADLVNGFFARANTHVLSVSLHTVQAFMENQLPPEADRLAFTKVSNDSGGQENPKDSVELVGDVLSLILSYEHSGKILSGYKLKDDPNPESFKPIAGNEDDFFKCLQTVHYYFNLIHNILDAWDSMINAGADIRFSKKRLDILSRDGLYPTLQMVNEVRGSNHFQEYFLPMILVLKKLREKIPAPLKTIISGITVANNLLQIKTGQGRQNLEDEIFTEIRLSLANEYLIEMPLPAFEDKTLTDLYRLLYALKQVPSYLAEHSIEVAKFSKMPAKIMEDDLSHYLRQMTGLSENFVHKFIDSISFQGNGEYEFWRTPLYKTEDDNIYLAFSVLQAPNFDLFTDHWMKLSGIDDHVRLTKWENYVRARLAKLEERNKIASFDILPKEKITDHPEHVVIIETDTHLLALILIVYNFPLEDAMKKELLTEISQRFASVSENLQPVAEYAAAAGKDLLRVGLSNYLHFSGLNINDVPLLDLTLLNNYIFTGKSEKVKTAPAGKRIKVSTFYAYTYYHNQEEFEENLPTFLKYPYPVHQLLTRMTFEERLIIPESIVTPIYIQAVTMVSIEQETMSELYELDATLKSEYLLGKGNRGRGNDEQIFQFLSRLFAKIQQSPDGSPDLIVEMVEAVKTSKSVTAAHLLTYIVKYASQLSPHQLVEKSFDFRSTNYEPEEFERIDRQVGEKLQHMSLGFSTYTDQLDLGAKDEIVFVNLLIDFLNTMSIGSYSMEQLGGFLQRIILLKGYYHKYPIKNHLYVALNNYVSLLNHNHYYDIARNVAYEAMTFAVSNNDRAEGWLLMFECYIKQKSIIYAGIYGGLLFTVLDTEATISKQLALQAIYGLMKHLREYGAIEMILKLFKLAKKFRLSDFDNQRFTLVAFHTRYLHGREAGGIKIVPEIITYLEKHKSSIKKYGAHGIAPWVNLMLNITASAQSLNKILPARFIELLNDLTEGDIHGYDDTNLYELAFGFGESTNQKLAEIISQCFQARNFDDFSHQILNLETYARHGLIYGIEKNDILTFWLCSFILNDQLLSFQPGAEVEGSVAFGNLPSQWSVADLLDYPRHLKEKLCLKKNQVLLWLTEVSGSVYSVTITHDHQVSFVQQEKWNVQQMRHWLRNSLPKFYFNSQKTKYYDYMEQEDIYQQLIKTLSGFDLNLTLDCQEILVLKSVDMAGFPDNLLINKNQLAGRDHSICNILNLEYFLSHQEDVFIQELTMSAWIPRSGQDPTISYGYDALSEILTGHQAVIFEETSITADISTSLNVFLAHGNVGRNGFNFIETGTTEKIISYEMFGKGDIAIMFVCSSGSVKEDFFAQDVVSLCQDLIRQGYKAVIAPFWKYDVTMAQIWLREFLTVFKEGYSVNECVHLANRRTGDYDFESGKLFHDPAGWAAMHLYGNPNIYFRSHQGAIN